MSKPRVLVTSVDVWNSTSGSDTFTNLLSGYDSSKIANIFIKSGIPTSPAADKYFYVCESSVIKSIIKRNIKTGWEVDKRPDEEEQATIEHISGNEKVRYAFFTKHRLRIFLLAREFCWKIGKWHSKELDKFIENFKPEVLFFPIESYMYFNRVNLYIAKKTGVPVISYMWDDNFTYKAHNDFGFKLQRWFLRRSVKKILRISNKVFVINDKMRDELKTEFGIDSEVLTKGAKIQSSSGVQIPNTPLTMVYTGKLIYGRFETIKTVAEVLGEINSNYIKIQFDIYSGTKLSDEQIRQLQQRGVSFRGSVTQDKIAEIQRNADLLLMAEALDGKHVYDARLSFSTKLVDYLATGKCIIAVGPKDIAPIEYLNMNNAALIASNKDEFKQIVEETIDADIITRIGNNALRLAKERHNVENIQNRLYSVFEEASSF